MAALLRALSLSGSAPNRVSERVCKVPQCDKAVLNDSKCEIHCILRAGSTDDQIMALKTEITGFEHDAKGVTWFALDSRSSILKTQCQTKRRFREFLALNETLLSIYQKEHPHLVPNLPDFPAKGVKVVQNHRAEEFVQERLAGLRTWLRKLLQIPHVAVNSHMMAFLGLRPAEDVLLARQITKIQVVGSHIEHGDIVYYHVDAWARHRVISADPGEAAETGNAGGEQEEEQLVFRTYSRYRQFSAFNDRLRRAIAQADDLSDVDEDDGLHSNGPSGPSSPVAASSNSGDDQAAPMPAPASPLQALHRRHPSLSTKYARYGYVFDRCSPYLPEEPDYEDDDGDDNNNANGGKAGKDQGDKDEHKNGDQQPKQQPRKELTAENLFELRYEPPLLREDMLEELPEFPIKRIRLLEDHLGDDFIRARIILLNNYLKKLIKLPGIGQHIVLLRFAGACTRDFSGFRATG